MKVLGDRIKKLREEKKITQTELGGSVNASKTTISNYETGYSSPDTEILSKLADVLETSADYLIGRTETHEVKRIEKETTCTVDVSGLPEEAVNQIIDYVEFIKQKFRKDVRPED